MELPFHYLIPEFILIAAACVATLLGLSKNDCVRKSSQVVGIVACLSAFLVAWFAGQNYPKDAFVHALYFNPNFITLLATGIGALSIMAAWNMPAKADPIVADKTSRGEFFGMLLFSLAGVSMIGKVNDLVWLFITLELVSIPTYILVATGRSQITAQEAGVKYFFLGALAAAIYLFGFSYLYGATGSTNFVAIQSYFATHASSPLAIIGLLMVILGLAYKIAAVPLHFYTPDVYQGAATPVTAYLAFAPKAAGFVAIIAMLTLINFDFTGTSGTAIMSVLSVLAVLTMTVGNVMALLQRNIKRIFAYSSISHSGYMLVGLIAGPTLVGSSHVDGVNATLFYLASYAVMNLGALSVLIYLQGKADAAEDLDDLAGVSREHGLAALMMSLCLLSLIGMPLTVGFLGKFYIVEAALSSGHFILAMFVILNAAIATAYYLKIIATMYVREPLYPFVTRRAWPIKATVALCTLGVIAFFFAPNILTTMNAHAQPVLPKVLTMNSATASVK